MLKVKLESQLLSTDCELPSSSSEKSPLLITMDEIEPRPRKSMYSIAIAFNLVAVAGLVAVTAYIVDRTFTTHGNVLFAWHPTFMSIGVRSNLHF